jgi:hypothetical protein
MSLETSRLRFTGVTGGPLRITGATLVNGAYELATAGGADYELQTERQTMLSEILFIPGIAPLAPGLLELFPNASVAFSTRRLRRQYTGPCVRVRRSSDNAEQDIGWAGMQLNTSDLSAFVGAGNGFVTTWYDQSGNGRNATQATSGSQPRIVNAGVIELQGTRPTIRNVAGGFLRTAGYTRDTQETMFSCLSATTLGSLATAISGDNGSTSAARNGLRSDAISSLNLVNGAANLSVTASVGSYVIFTRNGASFGAAIGLNGGALVTGTGATDSANNGLGLFRETATGAPARNWAGAICEVIIYTTDETANRTAIETNINSFYGVF